MKNDGRYQVYHVKPWYIAIKSSELEKTGFNMLSALKSLLIQQHYAPDLLGIPFLVNTSVYMEFDVAGVTKGQRWKIKMVSFFSPSPLSLPLTTQQ